MDPLLLAAGVLCAVAGGALQYCLRPVHVRVEVPAVSCKCNECAPQYVPWFEWLLIGALSTVVVLGLLLLRQGRAEAALPVQAPTLGQGEPVALRAITNITELEDAEPRAVRAIEGPSRVALEIRGPAGAKAGPWTPSRLREQLAPRADSAR